MKPGNLKDRYHALKKPREFVVFLYMREAHRLSLPLREARLWADSRKQLRCNLDLIVDYGWARVTPYLGVSLTPSGVREARGILKRRTALTLFYSRALCRPQSMVRAEVMKLESAYSTNFIRAVVRSVGMTFEPEMSNRLVDSLDISQGLIYLVPEKLAGSNDSKPQDDLNG